jgi:hypothetical protein
MLARPFAPFNAWGAHTVADVRTHTVRALHRTWLTAWLTLHTSMARLQTGVAAHEFPPAWSRAFHMLEPVIEFHRALCMAISTLRST